MKSFRNYKVFLFYLAFMCFIESIDAQSQPYLGQMPPTNTPVKFKPAGYISNSLWWWAGPPVFSSDGGEMYFTKYLPNKESHEIWYTKFQNGIWQSPQKVEFTKTDDDSYPTFVGGDDTLYYKSRYFDGGPIYRVTRTSEGWSEPVRLNIPVPTNQRIICFSVAKNGNLYLTLMGSESADFQENYKKADIFICRKQNDTYLEPENLGTAVNSTEGDAIDYIDPDERFILISSLRDGGLGYHDIYISIKNKDGVWEQAVPLSSAINGWHEDSGATITPDGKYLFFNSLKTGDNFYNPYWIEAQFIYDMLTSINVEENNELPSDYELNQNFPNPFNPSTTINYSVKGNKPVLVKIIVTNLLGQEVSTLVNTEQARGEYQIKFDGSNFTSGVYFYELNIEGIRKEVRKMNLIK